MSSLWDSFAQTCFQSCEQTFAEEIFYQTKPGDPFKILGIFSQKFIEMQSPSGVLVGSYHPTLEVRLNQFSQEPKVNDLLWVKSKKYKVSEIQKNLEGQALLCLIRMNEYESFKS